MTISADSTGPRTAPCPICGKPASMKTRPFCSPRCRDIDLGRWLKDSYRIPSDEQPGEEPDESQ